MKKKIAILAAFAIVVAASAFTLKPAIPKPHKHYGDVLFHYTVSTISDGAFTSTGNWEVAASNMECDDAGNIPCILVISDENLADISSPEAKVSSLVDYLSAQDGGSGEYASPTAAVTALTTVTKD